MSEEASNSSFLPPSFLSSSFPFWLAVSAIRTKSLTPAAVAAAASLFPELAMQYHPGEGSAYWESGRRARFGLSPHVL